MSHQRAYALAKHIGATLEYRRTGSAKHVDIQFAIGTAFDGNDGLDALHHECELDEDIWPGVIDDLRVAAGLASRPSAARSSGSLNE